MVTLEGEVLKEDAIESPGSRQFFPLKIKNFISQEKEEKRESYEVERLKSHIKLLENQKKEGFQELQLIQRLQNLRERQMQIDQFVKNTKSNN